MKIVIEARLRDPSGAGGVAQAIISLAAGLSALTDHRSGEEFVFVTLESAGPWLDPYVSGACSLHRVPLDWRERLSESPLGPAARAMRQLWRKVQPPAPDSIAQTDGLAEGLGADVIHFPMQQAYITDARTIYQPHDLQHLHLPELFTTEQSAWRNRAYPLFSKRAESVLVESTWTKDDLGAHFDIDPARIAVCPFPPATGAYAEMDEAQLTALKAKIPFTRFIFYPARTWPHKNHLALVEALAILRDRFGLTVPLVCSSSTTEHYTSIETRIRELGLESQILFIGFVREPELKALYQFCTAVVVPTKFESVSFPVWEAMEAGVAVACSNVTSLPAQVGNAGIIFDPDNPASIADAVRMLWQDEALCLRLGAEGKQRFAGFSLDRTARFIRALYRRVAGTAMPEDRALLAELPQI